MALQSIEQARISAGIEQTNKVSGEAALGKNEFLKLLVTQMQYQDPLSPQDNADFTAQLAQFSSLEQLFEVNNNLGGIATAQAPTGMASVAGFLDKNIVASGDKIHLFENGAAPVQFSLDGPAELANLVIRNQDGTVVRNQPLGSLPGGVREATWDGTDDLGNTLPQGTYRYAISAQDSAGDTVATQTEVRGRVDGAVYDGGDAYLTIGSQRIALTDVLSVRTPQATGG